MQSVLYDHASHIARVWINGIWLPILHVVSGTGNMIFPSPRSRLRIWSHETGPVVPSRVSPLISTHTQTESGVLTRVIYPAFHDGVHIIYSQPPLGQSRVHEVMQLRTDGVHCRESAGTVTGAAFSGITLDHFVCASLFPHPLLQEKYEPASKPPDHPSDRGENYQNVY